MGLNKPITVGGGLTTADVQSIIDAQNETLQGKMDAQTNTLKTDIPSSISVDAKAIKSIQRGTVSITDRKWFNINISPVNLEKSIVRTPNKCYQNYGNNLYSNDGAFIEFTSENSIRLLPSSRGDGFFANWEVIEFY